MQRDSTAWVHFLEWSFKAKLWAGVKFTHAQWEKLHLCHSSSKGHAIDVFFYFPTSTFISHLPFIITIFEHA